MVQRLTRFVVSLLLWLVAISFGLHLLTDMLRSRQAVVGATSPPSGSHPLAGFAIAVLVLFFALGLVVRLVRLIGAGDPRMARERAARERAMRLRVRRPAEGAPPVVGGRQEPADPDPAINDTKDR